MIYNRRDRPSAVFVFSYALRELLPLSLSGKTTTERLGNLLRSIRACLPALLNVLSIASLIVAATVIGGIVLGANRFMENKIINNPLALCIDADCGVGSKVKSIDQELLAKLRSLARAENKVKPDLSGAHRNERVLQGAFPWNDTSLMFIRENNTLDRDYTGGRSVSSGDIIYRKLSFIHGGPVKGEGLFSRPDAPEIVSSKGLIKDLGYSWQSPPRFLWISYNTVRARLRLVRVTTLSRYYGDFLLPDELDWKIKNNIWNPDPMHRYAFLGPIEKEQAETVLKAANHYVSRFRLTLTAKVEQRAGPELWLRFDYNEAFSRSHWQEIFFPDFLQDAEVRALFKSHEPDFGPADPPPWEQRLPLKKSYNHVSLYVKRLGDVPPTVDAVRELGLNTNPEVLNHVVSMRQISAFGRGALSAVVAVIAVIAGSNILLSFWQNIRRKTPEIGIFKAFGASNRLVTAIYFVESLIIWFIALVVGLSLAVSLGSTAEKFLAKTFKIAMEKGDHLFRTPFGFIAILVVGSLCVTAIATLLASRAATKIQPAEAVRMVGSM